MAKRRIRIMAAGAVVAVLAGTMATAPAMADGGGHGGPDPKPVSDSPNADHRPGDDHRGPGRDDPSDPTIDSSTIDNTQPTDDRKGPGRGPGSGRPGHGIENRPLSKNPDIAAAQTAYKEAVKKANDDFKSAMKNVRAAVSSETRTEREAWLAAREAWRTALESGGDTEAARDAMKTAREAYKSALSLALEAHASEVETARNARQAALKAAREARDKAFAAAKGTGTDPITPQPLPPVTDPIPAPPGDGSVDPVAPITDPLPPVDGTIS